MRLAVYRRKRHNILTQTFYVFFRVEIPNGEYNGQKLTKLVIIKIIANAPKTSARVPPIVLVKYSTATIAANAIRIILSVNPMFFFIVHFYLVVNYFKTLLWQTKSVFGTSVFAIALKPPSISVKFLKPRASKIEAAIILRYPPAQCK
jgi:hypothetical protein